MPKTKSPMPATDNPTPTKSSFGFGTTAGASVMSPDARSTPRTMSASAPKATRQLRYVVTQPPMSGPKAAPAAATPKRIPYAEARLDPLKFARTSVLMAGTMSADPNPSRIDQPNMTKPMVGAKAVIVVPTP